MTAIPFRLLESNSARVVSSLPAGPATKIFLGRYEFNNVIEEEAKI